MSHGALGVFLKLVEDGAIERGSVLLVEHLDRFTRQNPLAGMELLLKLVNAGIDLVTLMDRQRYNRELLTRDLGAQIKLQFTLFQSHEESAKKSVRLADVWTRKRARARDGKVISKQRPAWVDNETGKVIDAKADVVRGVFKLALAGAGPCKIAKKLNQEGVAPIGLGKVWSNNLVRIMLTSRRALGEYQPCRVVDGRRVPQGEPVTDYYPAVIDRVTFFAAQRILDKRKSVGLAGRVSNNKNLFTRLLYNIWDGGRYHLKEYRDARTGKEYVHRRMVPANKLKGIDGLNLVLDYDHFERSFFSFVREVDVPSLFAPKDQSAKGQELAERQADLLDLDGRLNAYKARAKKGKEVETILDLIQETEAERKEIAKRVELLKSQLTTSEARLFEDLREILDDPAARGKVAGAIRLLVDRIDLLPIPTRTGKYRVAHYILYAEILFNNGQTRIMICSPDWETTRVHAALGRDASADVVPRNEVIRELADFASDEWKGRLLERFGTQ